MISSEPHHAGETKRPALPTSTFGDASDSSGCPPPHSKGKAGTTRRQARSDSPNFEEINAVALANLPSLVQSWFPAGQFRGREYVLGGLHGEPGESLSINTQTGRWADFADGAAGGDPVSLYAAAFTGGKQAEAGKRLAAELGLDRAEPAERARVISEAREKAPKPDAETWEPMTPDDGALPDWISRKASRIWTYHDATGKPFYHVLRIDRSDSKKEFRGVTYGRRVWTDNAGKDRDETGWHFKHPREPLPLYGLDRLAARPDAPVIVCEGEKAADAAGAGAPSHVAVTWPRGSSNAHLADWSPLAGRYIVIWPDNDEPGRKAAAVIASKLDGVAADVVTLDVSDMEPGADAADLPGDTDFVGWMGEHHPESSIESPFDGEPPPDYDDTLPFDEAFVVAPKPDLRVDMADLPAAARAACSLMANSGSVFDRGGVMVRVSMQKGEPARITCMSHHGLTAVVHDLAQPVTTNSEGEVKRITFPDRAARIAVDIADTLPPLDGVAKAPLLSDDGMIRTAEGYDPSTRLWCSRVPPVRVPDTPRREDAEAAFRMLRTTFDTFPFEDSPRRTAYDINVVDTVQSPGEAESAFLAALITAICRPSLPLAPGLLLTAPSMSGAGAGKGLLTRAIARIAYGNDPSAFTAGDPAELDKRLASALIQPGSMIFVDNVNGAALKSDLLASLLTEPQTRIRMLGRTHLMDIKSNSFVIVTGNGLTVAEDLARRFLTCRLDPKCEDPESRDFPGGTDGFLAEVRRRRAELLGAALTIWRWGRQNRGSLTRGKPIGSFETWASWVRDPLLTLGCRDPIEAIARAKANDPHRNRVVELFTAWWDAHHDYPMRANDLADTVKEIVNPQGRSRQYLATAVSKLESTRAAGFVLTKQAGAGVGGPATYALKREEQPF